MRRLAETEGGVIARQLMWQINPEAVALQQFGYLFCQHAILKYPTAKTDLVDGVRVA